MCLKLLAIIGVFIPITTDHVAQKQTDENNIRNPIYWALIPLIRIKQEKWKQSAYFGRVYFYYFVKIFVEDSSDLWRESFDFWVVKVQFPTSRTKFSMNCCLVEKSLELISVWGYFRRRKLRWEILLKIIKICVGDSSWFEEKTSVHWLQYIKKTIKTFACSKTKAYTSGAENLISIKVSVCFQLTFWSKSTGISDRVFKIRRSLKIKRWKKWHVCIRKNI